jgi:hypothetical protein
MTQIIYQRFKHMSGKRTSTQREVFLDMVNNPTKYKGYIVYLKDIDDDEIYSPFDHPGTFYMNEGGTWHSTDFHSQIFEE